MLRDRRDLRAAVEFSVCPCSSLQHNSSPTPCTHFRIRTSFTPTGRGELSRNPGTFSLTFKLRLAVARVLVQALLLVDDDVLNVLHGEVVTEGMVQDVLQLLQRYPLHVKLWETAQLPLRAQGSKESRQCHNPQFVFYQPHFNTPVWAVALWGCCTLTVNAGNRCCPCQLPWHGWSSRENQPCARSGFPGWRGSNPVHPNKEKTLRDSPGSSHTCHEPQPCFCPSFTSLTPQLCLGGRNKKRTLHSELTSGL